MSSIQAKFKVFGITVTGNLKTNLHKISQKVDEYEKEEGEGADGLGKFTITDMVRATLHVKNPEEMIPAYEVLLDMEELNIVKITNKMCTGLQNVTINFIYTDMIVGEI